MPLLIILVKKLISAILGRVIHDNRYYDLWLLYYSNIGIIYHIKIIYYISVNL